MRWFYDLTIASKLISSFITMATITAIVGLIGVADLGSIHEMLSSLYNRETVGISYAKQADIDLIYFARAQKDYLISVSSDWVSSYRGS